MVGQLFNIEDSMEIHKICLLATSQITQMDLELQVNINLFNIDEIFQSSIYTHNTRSTSIPIITVDNKNFCKNWFLELPRPMATAKNFEVTYEAPL